MNCPGFTARRVKCDETRPLCLRCERCRVLCSSRLTPRISGTKAGRACEYVPCASSERLVNPSQYPSYATSAQISAIQFFHERTLPDICRSFPDKLWATWVPQLAVMEPIVWHSLVSISLHHKLYHQRFNPLPEKAASSGQAVSVLALKEYNTALRCLAEFPKQPQYLYLQVISCVSFLTIEVSYTNNVCPVKQS